MLSEFGTDRNALVSGFKDARYGLTHKLRFTISCLISPMARAGLSPFGQACAQFMIVWQR